MMLAAFLGFIAGFGCAVAIYEFVHMGDLTTRTDQLSRDGVNDNGSR